jgi:hypothetical protein
MKFFQSAIAVALAGSLIMTSTPADALVAPSSSRPWSHPIPALEFQALSVSAGAFAGTTAVKVDRLATLARPDSSGANTDYIQSAEDLTNFGLSLAEYGLSEDALKFGVPTILREIETAEDVKVKYAALSIIARRVTPAQVEKVFDGLKNLIARFGIEPMAEIAYYGWGDYDTAIRFSDGRFWDSFMDAIPLMNDLLAKYGFERKSEMVAALHDLATSLPEGELESDNDGVLHRYGGHERRAAENLIVGLEKTSWRKIRFAENAPRRSDATGTSNPSESGMSTAELVVWLAGILLVAVLTPKYMTTFMNLPLVAWAAGTVAFLVRLGANPQSPSIGFLNPRLRPSA